MTVFLFPPRGQPRTEPPERGRTAHGPPKLGALRRLSSGFRLPAASSDGSERALSAELRSRIRALSAAQAPPAEVGNGNGPARSDDAREHAGELSVTILRLRSIAVERAVADAAPVARGDPSVEAMSVLGERLSTAMAHGGAWAANVAAAASRVEAIDEAEEASVLSRAQVLLDTGTSVLATANQLVTIGQSYLD